MPTEQQSQEDQINAAVVGRGVRLPMGDPVEVVEPVQEPARILEREPQPEVEAPPKGNGSSKSAAMPHVEEMGLMGDSASPATHKQGRRWGKPDAEDIAPMGETGERPVKRGKKKPLTKSQKIFVASGVLALVLVAASNLIPKEMPTTAPLAQTGPGADATAPMPKDSAPLLIELTPEDVELLKAAKLQKAKEAAGALRAIESDGPLPTELSNVPAAAPESLTPLSAGAVVTPASANALHAQEVKPGAKMPSTAPVANQQAEPPSKPVDRYTANMDIPLTQDQGVPSDIAGLKDVSERANKAPPVAKLAAPLEESKAPPKAEAKHDQKQEAKPPAVEALKKQPAVTTTAAKMEATAQKKIEPEPLKKAEVKPVEKPKLAKPARVAEESRKPKLAHSEADDELASGYALPIREVHANGRPVAQAKPAAQEPAKTVFAEPKQTSKMTRSTPDVMHVDVGYGVVTNPTTQLPIRVKVGDALPNGAVVSGFDPVKGLINTSRGSYGMK